MSDRSWSVVQLRSELERYEGELRAAGKEQRTIDTYLGQSAAICSSISRKD